MTKNITFTVSVEEANKIFKALGNLPFNDVYELIGKLNEQANIQLTSKGRNSDTYIGSSNFGIDELLK